MPSVTETVKSLFKEERKEIESQLLGVWLWGFGCGAIIAYTSLLPFVIGGVFGYSIAKTDLTIAREGFIYLSELYSKKVS